MAVIVQVPVEDPKVRLYRPHNPAGRWTIEVDGEPQNGTGWHGSPFGGDIQMTEPRLRALRDALNRELPDVPPGAVLSMDVKVFGVPLFGVPADTVPVTYTGLPDAPATVAAEPETERWAR